MNSQQKQLCQQLAALSSEQAVEWLMKTYSLESMEYGEALLLIPHRSWKRSDQRRLASYYFKKIPFSSARGYEVFSSFMSVKTFIECVRDNLPANTSDRALLLYYLTPVLGKAAKNESDRLLARGFLSEVGSCD